jgi:hypothetical protein
VGADDSTIDGEEEGGNDDVEEGIHDGWGVMNIEEFVSLRLSFVSLVSGSIDPPPDVCSNRESTNALSDTKDVSFVAIIQLRRPLVEM